jgi:hypothetical protein
LKSRPSGCAGKLGERRLFRTYIDLFAPILRSTGALAGQIVPQRVVYES